MTAAERPDRFPTWANFSELIERGVPVSIPVTGEPLVFLYVADQGHSIGFRVPVPLDAELAPSPLEEVELELISAEGNLYVDVSTGRRSVFEAYYALMCGVTDRLQLGGESISNALQASLNAWQELLRPVLLLSPEERVGLWGELWALDRLIVTRGKELADAWTGPMGEPHDLRLGAVEVEVKTSTSRTRTHMFNGLLQLEPSPGHTLLVLSILVEPAGMRAGKSLPERVASIRALLNPDPVRLTSFNERIHSLGYRDERDTYYRERFQLRFPAALIPVGAGFPSLTAATLSALGGEYERRLREVHYRLDLEGLGDPDGTQPFHQVFPARGSDD